MVRIVSYRFAPVTSASAISCGFATEYQSGTLKVPGTEKLTRVVRRVGIAAMLMYTPATKLMFKFVVESRTAFLSNGNYTERFFALSLRY